jgi:hypothetical protein
MRCALLILPKLCFDVHIRHYLITSYGLSLFPVPHNLIPDFTCFGPSFEMQV